MATPFWETSYMSLLYVQYLKITTIANFIGTNIPGKFNHIHYAKLIYYSGYLSNLSIWLLEWGDSQI